MPSGRRNNGQSSEDDKRFSTFVRYTEALIDTIKCSEHKELAKDAERLESDLQSLKLALDSGDIGNARTAVGRICLTSCLVEHWYENFGR